MLAFICALFGLVLVYIEFFLPGAVAATLGGSLLLLSIIFFASGHYFVFVVSYVVFLLLLVIGVCKLGMWQIRRFKEKNALYSEMTQQGFKAVNFDEVLVGQVGICTSDLKPSGFIEIRDKRHQALSQSGYLTKDTSIIVIGGEGAHLIVRKHNLEIL